MAVTIIRGFVYGVIAGALLLLVATVIMVLPALSHESCRGFLNPACCCTRGGCFEIGADEYRDLGGDRYLIIRTGETVARTGWSKNGIAYRCTYDDNWSSGGRIGHIDAKTRCFYPVPSEAGA